MTQTWIRQLRPINSALRIDESQNWGKVKRFSQGSEKLFYGIRITPVRKGARNAFLKRHPFVEILLRGIISRWVIPGHRKVIMETWIKMASELLRLHLRTKPLFDWGQDQELDALFLFAWFPPTQGSVQRRTAGFQALAVLLVSRRCHRCHSPSAIGNWSQISEKSRHRAIVADLYK